MSFTFKPYQLPGLLVVEGKAFPDDRGVFMESFRAQPFLDAGLPPFVQDNLSRSKKGVLRGLHYQAKSKPVGKLVRCTRGRIFDVAVDIRKDSPAFGKWAGIELSDDGNTMFWVPEGFAHGFYALSESADVQYKVTDYWSPEVDRGLLWSDPQVGVKWPSKTPILTAKDAALPVLAKAETY